MTSMAPIPNFRQVSDWLYRGGQPARGKLKTLADMGIKTIVSLRSGKFRAAMERQEAEALGMRFIHLPFSYLKTPDAASIEGFLAIIDRHREAPVYVHCLHGVDRTGFLVAVIRISRFRWSVDEAYNEMKRCGFHSFSLPHFKWELWRYAKRSQLRNNDGDFAVEQASTS